MKRIRNQ